VTSTSEKGDTCVYALSGSYIKGLLWQWFSYYARCTTHHCLWMDR